MFDTSFACAETQFPNLFYLVDVLNFYGVILQSGNMRKWGQDYVI